MVSRVRRVGIEFQRLQIARFQAQPASWEPAVDVYLCEGRLDVCFDLAGVSPAEVTVSIDDNRLIVSGSRTSPEQLVREHPARCRRILAMEIESGRFRRELALPVEIDIEATEIDCNQGLFWVRMPLRRRQT